VVGRLPQSIHQQLRCRNKSLFPNPMREVLMKICCVCAWVLFVLLLCFAAHSLLYAEVAPTGERIINLPNDQGKWYLSVVGISGNETYERLMGWFNTDHQLMDLRNQVRFCIVRSGTPIFNERYKDNIKGLPTIRLQEADGTVVYEVYGSNIPDTADALYVDISGKVCAYLRPILPWRRDMERRCPKPLPAPDPQPQPNPQPDPEPQPIDDGGPPEMVEPKSQQYPVVLFAIMCAVAGASAGFVIRWKKTYPKEGG